MVGCGWHSPCAASTQFRCLYALCWYQVACMQTVCRGYLRQHTSLHAAASVQLRMPPASYMALQQAVAIVSDRS
jgi:hypothetical protein